MNNRLKLAMAASAIALFAGCEADGGKFGGGGDTPDNPGSGDPGLLGLGGITNLAGWTITQRGGGNAEEIQSGAVCAVEELVLAGVLGLGEGLCYVNNQAVNTDQPTPVNVVDKNGDTYSVINLVASVLDDPIGVLPSFPDPVNNAVVASAGVGVDLSGTVGAGNVAAFDVELPPGVVQVNLLRDAQIRTYLDGVAQESFEGLQILGLDLLNLNLESNVGDTRFILGCVNALPYNRIEIEVGGLVSAEAVDLNGDLPSGPDNLLDFVSGETLYVYDVVTGAAPPEDVDITDEALLCTRVAPAA